MNKKRRTAAKVTANLDQHLDFPGPLIAVRSHLHKQTIFGRAAIPKSLVKDVNAKRRLQWGHNQKLVRLRNGR
ncbi:hypothetical protein TNCV_4212271 [Trichonephila clavipes]|nr:hypothetical protein TNCV_4212271 [Trichonephila clavipes]